MAKKTKGSTCQAKSSSNKPRQNPPHLHKPCGIQGYDYGENPDPPQMEVEGIMVHSIIPLSKQGMISYPTSILTSLNEYDMLTKNKSNVATTFSVLMAVNHIYQISMQVKHSCLSKSGKGLFTLVADDTLTIIDSLDDVSSAMNRSFSDRKPKGRGFNHQTTFEAMRYEMGKRKPSLKIVYLQFPGGVVCLGVLLAFYEMGLMMKVESMS